MFIVYIKVLFLPDKSKLMSNRECFKTPVATSAVEHNVVIILPRKPHLKFVLKLLWGQLQRLFQHPHCLFIHKQCENSQKSTLLHKFAPTGTLTWDIDSIWNTSSLAFIWVSHIKQLNVPSGQHGLQL